METIVQNGVRIAAVAACVPPCAVDNLERAEKACGAEKAESVVKSTGFRTLRVANPGVTAFDLCLAASERALALCGVPRNAFGAVVAVSITPDFEMPGLSNRLQAALGLPGQIAAVDLRMACSGYVSALHVASMYAAATGSPVLLADGDVQTAFCDPLDPATAPVLADAASATIVLPSDPADARPPWRFAFMSDGSAASALRLPAGGKISMDGFAVFRFATTDVLRFLRDFAASVGASPGGGCVFVPHQANMYMVSRIAKSLGFAPDCTWTCCGEYGNPGSASVPLAIARCGGLAPRSRPVRLFLAGFGGGLSASAALVDLPPGAPLAVFDYPGASAVSREREGGAAR